MRTPPAGLSFVPAHFLMVTLLSVSKSKEIRKFISYLLLIAASVVCITVLALLVVPEDFPCLCLRPLLQRLGALSQAQIAVRPHRLACARCGQAVPGCRCVRRNSYSSSARIYCCTPVELALRCCSSCCCLVLSIDGPHLIQDRLQDCLVCCALCYPASWINVPEVPPDAGSTTYKDMLAVLALLYVLERLSCSSMTLT